jgi:hypothetical protein
LAKWKNVSDVCERWQRRYWRKGFGGDDGLMLFLNAIFLISMKTDEVMHALERAQAYAYPGHEAVERDHVLRELWRALQRPPAGDAAAPLLRLVRC